MSNLILVVILVAILGAACYYMFKSKKRGIKCIGCDANNSCGVKSEKDRCIK